MCVCWLFNRTSKQQAMEVNILLQFIKLSPQPVECSQQFTAKLFPSLFDSFAFAKLNLLNFRGIRDVEAAAAAVVGV